MKPLIKYRSSRKKLILLDYDGTLVSFTNIPDEAKPSVSILNILYKLCCESSTKVVIVTGREYRSIDRLVGHLPIDIIAEHGAMIKLNGIWNDRIKNIVLWKHQVLPVLNQFTSECGGSFIEEKRFSIAWHYRNVDLIGGYIFSRDLIRVLGDVAHFFNLKILDGNNVVEIMIKEIGKGNAVRSLVEHCDYDCILAIGDDRTDEEMFEYLLPNANAFTIKVGTGKTVAKYKLDDFSGVLSFLEQLTIN